MPVKIILPSHFSFWKPTFRAHLNGSIMADFFLNNYLKTQKSHFWGAWKTLIFTITWAQNSRMGLKNCAKHDFGTENLISPLFGAVRDLQNRQKSGFFKIGSGFVNDLIRKNFWSKNIFLMVQKWAYIDPNSGDIEFLLPKTLFSYIDCPWK